jgi:predicted nucleic acid-binding protein
MNDTICLAYMDNCCYHRPYDSQDHPQVAKDTEVIRVIRQLVSSKDVGLVWSFVLDYEKDYKASPQKVADIAQWKSLCCLEVGYSPVVEQVAAEVMATGVKKDDAYHVAAAIVAGCQFFITTDKRLLKYKDNRITICNPERFLTIILTL